MPTQLRALFFFRCSSDREAKVRCNLILAENVIPPEYNYSVPNLYFDRKGHNVNGYGHVDIADYCPYYRVSPYLNPTAFMYSLYFLVIT